MDSLVISHNINLSQHIIFDICKNLFQYYKKMNQNIKKKSLESTVVDI